MNTSKNNTTEQDQTNLFSTEDKLENGFHQDLDFNNVYDDCIDYDDYDDILDIQVAIECTSDDAYLNFKEIKKSRSSSLKRSLHNIKKKVDFYGADAELNIVIEKYNIAESKNCEFIFNAFWKTITQYVVKNNIGVLKIDEAKDKPMWMNSSNRPSCCNTPVSLDALELTLYRSKPAKIIFLQSTNYASNMCNDLIFGFGIYLFDKKNNLISKIVYKFFDESIAPENALRLNIPTTLGSFYDSSRPFF